MTTTAPPASRSAGSRSRLHLLSPVPPGRLDDGFAWRVTAANLWILVGLFLDGWFHINGPEQESFFTPWHAVLYSGVLATTLVHLHEAARAGGTRPGYAPSLAGGAVVLLAGALDGAWHTAFGVEADTAALLSPPHLLLITAGTLVFAGPLRAALRAGRGVPAGLPTAFAAAFVVAGLGFFTQYSSPFTQVFAVAEPGATAAAVELREVAGIAGTVVWAALLAGAVAVLAARTGLVRGSLLVVVAVPHLLLVTQQERYELLPAVLVAAVLVELAGRRLRVPALAALTGALVATGWVLSLLVTADVAWSRELLTGAIGSAAAAGFLVGWAVAPGSRPE